VRITRPRHPLQDKLLQVLGGMRRHGVIELLLVLPDGSKSLVPAAWTDADPSTVNGEGVVGTLGSVSDLLQVGELVTGLSPRELHERGQAAGMSPCKEDSVQPVQLSLIPDPPPTSTADPLPAPPAPTVEQLPADAVTTAITLLANVIAKAAAPRRSEVAGDE